MRSVLIVEDSTPLRAVARKCFEDFDFTEVYEATDGKAALELYEKYKPDLVILDMILPKLDGVSVLTRLVGRHPEAYVVLALTTALTKEQEEAYFSTNTYVSAEESFFNAFKIGAMDYIKKPYTAGNILSVIEKYQKVASGVYCRAKDNVEG